MTDPERLLSGGTLFERSLLAPAVADKPSAALLARMEQGLGLVPAATAGALATAGAAATAASTAASASAVTSKSVLAVLGSAAAGGLAIWGVVALSSPAPVIPSQSHARSVAVEVALPKAKAVPPRASAEPDRAQGSSAALPVPAHAEVADLPLVDAEEGEASDSALRRSRSRATNDASRVNPGPPLVKGDRLKQEVQQLDRVRAALGNGDRARALELLDGYDRKFPSGTLAPEAAKLRQSARR
jgi:hypothetical protein